LSTNRAAEVRVERWLRALGLGPQRFDVRRQRRGKTPDFRVDDRQGGCFLVEVKGLTRGAIAPFALAAKVARARAQFEGVNQGGRLANVLVLVTGEPGRLVRLLDDRATAGVDLVVGLADDGGAPVLLHRRPDGRHASYLADVLPLGDRP
jgi:hypothetical protein